MGHTPPTLDSHTFTTQLPLMSSPSVKLILKLTQLSSITLMEPATHVASTYAHYPYTTTVAGYPYNKVVAGVPAYTTGYTYPVVHSLGKREAEADSDAALYYRTYGYNYGSPYTYGAYPYRNVYGWY